MDSSPSSAFHLQPVAEKDRYAILDILRGIALFGIFMINIQLFSGYKFAPFWYLKQLPTYNLDEALYWIIDFVINEKFYTMFSLLFGYGFYLTMLKNRTAVDIHKTYALRIGVLFLLGVVHSLIWYSDILVLFALAGAVLYFFRNRRKLLQWALFFYFLNIALDVLMIAFLPETGLPSSKGGLAEAHAVYPDMIAFDLLQSFGSGSLKELLSINLHNLYWRWLAFVPTGKPIKVLGLFLLGSYLASRQMFTQDNFKGKTVVLLLMMGVSMTAIAHLIDGSSFAFPPTPLNTLYKLFLSGGQISLSLAYMSIIVMLFRNSKAKKVLMLFSSCGRLSLTIYLSQSIICVLIFYSVGFGLFGLLGLSSVLIVYFGILFLQVLCAEFWIRRFYFGPVEWIWRLITYRQMIPLRR